MVALDSESRQITETLLLHYCKCLKNANAKGHSCSPCPHINIHNF